MAGGEREEENVPDGGGSERRLARAWCILGNQSVWPSFCGERGVADRVEGLSGRAKEC